MRRQKCDRKLPCTRCIRDGKPEACSLEWPDGYNPHIHRKYPNPKAALRKHDQLSNDATTSQRNDGSDTMVDEMSRSPPTNPSPADSEQTVNFASPRMAQKTPTDFGMLLTSISPYEPEISSQNIPNTSVVDQIDQSLAVNENEFMHDGCSLITQHLAPHRGSDQRLDILQTLIPSSNMIRQLVDYHEKTLAWFHNSINLPLFHREVSEALQKSGNIELRCQDMRWCALLFAVMAASLACASTSSTRSWGFGRSEKCLLATRWYEAIASCLQLGHYASKHHMHSIQAVQVGAISAHILGFSNEQFVLFGSCYRLAQSLGLHKLAIDGSPESPDTLRSELSQLQRDTLIKRETGRKLWTGLCTQDWLSIASSDMYCLHKKQFTTSKPRRVDIETMSLVDKHIPIGVDFGNYMYDIASLMADFHDATAGLEDVSEHYDEVLKYDSRLRALGPETCLPPSLKSSSMNPPWVRWARLTCHVLHAHKLIMMHRRFLSRSFTNPKFTYTRWASVDSAKKILELMETACSDIEMPAVWSCQVRHLFPSHLSC